MKKLFVLLAFLPALLMSFTAAAYGNDELDNEGYPYLYVRGTMTDNWTCLDNYKFTRTGDVYSISLSNLNGTFKIGGSDWQYNLGGKSLLTISSSTTFIGTQDGSDITANNLNNVTISFKYKADGYGIVDTQITITTSNNGGNGGGGGSTGYQPSGTLPILYINVYLKDGDGNFVLDAQGNKVLDNYVIDKDLADKNYRAGEYWLDLNGCQWLADLGAASVGSEGNPLPLEIKARGNYTRTGFAKKPFKLKLGSKQKLLGMGSAKSKHWAILAHADDNKGYLRNFVGFNLGQRIGLPWTPSQQPIEVVINGDYRGLYFLTESIRVGDGRVPITELADNAEDPALISGGYLIELDNYDEENQIKMTELGQAPGYKDVLRVTYDTPEKYSDIQYRFVYEQFDAMNNLVGQNSDDLWKYIDMDDLARYYLVEEIISHYEAFHGSTYMYRDNGEGQKWHFSPLWDCGNAFNGSTSGFFYNGSLYGNTWIPSIRLNNKFNDKVKATWLWFMSNRYDGLINDIDTYVSHITEAAKADRARWASAELPNSMNASAVANNSDMQARRNEVVNHLNSKINWLKSQFGNYSNGNYTEPAKDTTAPMELPEYAKPENVFGDLDGDGKVDINDLSIILNIIVGLY